VATPILFLSGHKADLLALQQVNQIPIFTPRDAVHRLDQARSGQQEEIRPEGFEPPTLGSEDRGRMHENTVKQGLSANLTFHILQRTVHFARV